MLVVVVEVVVEVVKVVEVEVVASVGGWCGSVAPLILAGVVRPGPATQNLTTSQASPQPAISEGQLW